MLLKFWSGTFFYFDTFQFLPEEKKYYLYKASMYIIWDNICKVLWVVLSYDPCSAKYYLQLLIRTLED